MGGSSWGIVVGTAGTLRLEVKRAYEPPAKSDGKRILVDRIWPRGVTKAALSLHSWAKELAPSTTLRKWFGHDPEKWDEFRRRYFQELDKQPEAIEALAAECREGPVTLIFAAKDVQHNQAIALRQYLREWIEARS